MDGTVAVFGGATDDNALGSGVLIDESRVLTSLSVASGAAGLWVTFPQAGAVVRHPVTRVRTSGGLAVLSLAAPAPRSARPAPLRFPVSLRGERWSVAGGFAYGVVGADAGEGRVRLSVSSAGRPAVGAGVWAPRWGAVVAVVESSSVAWTLSGARLLLSWEADASPAGDVPPLSRAASQVPVSSPGGHRGRQAGDDVPERSPMIRPSGDAGPAGRSWSLEASAEPGRLWRPGADGGPVEGDPWPPGADVGPVEGDPWPPGADVGPVGSDPWRPGADANSAEGGLRRPGTGSSPVESDPRPPSGTVESESSQPAGRLPERETASRRKSVRPPSDRRAEPPSRGAWMAGARQPERVPSAGGAVTLLCPVTIGDRILVASAAADGTVALADPATGQARHILRTEPGQVRSLVPLRLPDATCLGVVTADGSLTAWAPEQGWGQTFTVHGGRATTATCAEAGMLAVGGEDGTVEVRALGEARPLWTATAGGGPVAALCALPGLIAAAGADGRIRLHDTESGALRRTLGPEEGPLRAICPVPIGDRTLLGTAGDDGLVLLWDPNTGERRHELAGHSGPVTAVCPVPGADGRTAVLASAGVDRTARLWDPLSGECRMVAPLHHEATACVAAGAHLIIGLAAGTVAYSLDI
jgi:WD40 repeat protein